MSLERRGYELRRADRPFLVISFQLATFGTDTLINRSRESDRSSSHRRMMRRYFERPRERRRYGQRWQVETVMSMIKRRLGEALSARSYHRQCRAMLLKVIAHNVLILL